MKSVPVLSKTTADILGIFSKTVFFLIRMDDLMAIFSEVAITDGIARPSAQGQDAMRTAMKRSKG